MSTSASQQPSPILFFQTINAHQHTEALKAAIELEIFTAIGEGNKTVADIAKRCNTSEKGTRVLCDYLTVLGMLTKEDNTYGLTLDSSVFLDKNSPAYIGGATQFLCSDLLTAGFKDVAGAVRRGGSTLIDDGVVGHDNPIWVTFARAMAPMTIMPSQMMANLIDPQADRKLKILDIAAGHGLYGLAFAKRNPHVEVTAVDWSAVLQVAKENAEKFGVADRYHTIEGSAFDVDFGTGYDIALLTNFLHHFDQSGCETILRKVRAALADGGRAVTLEFVPNADRISPPEAATFAMVMLANTPSGDAYTFAELEKMSANAGFTKSTAHPIPQSPETIVISEK